MAEADNRDALQPLRDLAVLREHRFTSHVPVVGGLIAGFRRVWNGISTRWYVAPLVQQQSEINQLVVDRLADLAARPDRHTEELAALHDEVRTLRDELKTLQEWLINQDREQMELRHDLGEVALRVGQWTRGLDSRDDLNDSDATTDLSQL